MTPIAMQLLDERSAYQPGERVRVHVSWSLSEQPRDIRANLFWFTQGKGTTDTVVVESLTAPVVNLVGEWSFEFSLPAAGPFSYSGRLLSVCWAIEVIAEKRCGFARQDLIVSPTGAPIVPRDVP